MQTDSSVLFRSRVLFVSGKGGTGKTTVSAALGRLAAAQGRRTLVLEVDAQKPSLTACFGQLPVYQPAEVEKNLSVSNIAWDEALGDWVEGMVAMRRLVRMIMKNRVVNLFLNVTPGARDLVVLWRITQLAAKYDTVIVDMPASGNAVAMLAVPHTAERLFAAGPIRKCADEILGLYSRADTRVVLVAIPEEMVVNETVETVRKLRRELRDVHMPAVILNRASIPTLTAAERAILDGLGAAGLEGVAAELVEAGAWESRLEAATEEAQRRLFEEAALPVLMLPTLSRGQGAAKIVSQLTAAFARTSASHVELRR